MTEGNVLHHFVLALADCGCDSVQTASHPLDTSGLLQVISDIEIGEFKVELDTLYRILIFTDMYVAMADTSAARLSLTLSDEEPRVHYALTLAVDARKKLDLAYSAMRKALNKLGHLQSIARLAGQAVAQAIHSLAATSVGLDRITYAEANQATLHMRGYLQRRCESQFKELIISTRKKLNW